MHSCLQTLQNVPRNSGFSRSVFCLLHSVGRVINFLRAEEKLFFWKGKLLEAVLFAVPRLIEKLRVPQSVLMYLIRLLVTVGRRLLIRGNCYHYCTTMCSVLYFWGLRINDYNHKLIVASTFSSSLALK